MYVYLNIPVVYFFYFANFTSNLQVPPIPVLLNAPIELVPEPFPPKLIDEDRTLAFVYLGPSFADFLQRVRDIRWLSPVIYICSASFMISGCVLFAVKSMTSFTMLVRVLSVVMYCTSGFAVWQSAQSTLRLVQSLMVLLLQSFDCWYEID